MVFACNLAPFDWEFVEVFFGLWVLPGCFVDFARLSFAFFMKLVGAKIQLGGPKSGWTFPLSSNCWKTSKVLWRFFQREKDKDKCSSPPSENRPGVFKQPCSELAVTSKTLPRALMVVFKNWIDFVLVGCLGRESLVKPWLEWGTGEDRKGVWMEAESLNVSGQTPPTQANQNSVSFRKLQYPYFCLNTFPFLIKNKKCSKFSVLGDLDAIKIGIYWNNFAFCPLKGFSLVFW